MPDTFKPDDSGRPAMKRDEPFGRPSGNPKSAETKRTDADKAPPAKATPVKENPAAKLNPNAPKIKTPSRDETKDLTPVERDAAEVDRRVQEGLPPETDTERNERRSKEL